MRLPKHRQKGAVPPVLGNGHHFQVSLPARHRLREANVQGVEACIELMPGVPQIAVFDTAFHTTMPAHAYRYAIPKEAYTKWAIRRYGFHGTSHKFVAAELEKVMGRKGKFIICHVGNGASVSRRLRPCEVFSRGAAGHRLLRHRLLGHAPAAVYQIGAGFD